MVLRRSVDFIPHRYLRLLIVIVTVLCLGGISVVSAQDAPAVDIGLCATTVEQLHGQGRFEMGGLSRFSFSGLEGSNNDLNSSSLDPAVVAEVLGNRVTPNWLVSLMPLLASGEDFNDHKVAVLVVDDFPDHSLTFNAMNQLPGKWRKQFEDKGIAPTFPLEVPVVTHGMQVFLAMNDMLDTLKAVHPGLKVALHRVDISAGGSYRLALLTTAIETRITALKLQGYNRFIINMSFGLIPCSDSASGFDFSLFSTERLARLLDLAPATLNQNFTFDLDGRTFEALSADEVIAENRPVVYQDYGLLQYLAEEIVSEQPLLGSAGQLLKGLLGSPLLLLDSDEPSMISLRLLLTTHQLQSSLGLGYYIPVAASGNYADLVTPDAPLAPASLPEVVAVGATLGESGNKWQYSQAAHLLAPGAWYDYSTKSSYVAGTSFAAPMVSMIAALYLTYPDACNFDGAHPPLLNLDHANVEIKPYYTGFDCDPMLGPDDPVQLLTNRSFETQDIKNTSADRWRDVKLAGDKRVVNQMGKSPVAQFGGAAFQFNGTASTTSSIWQKADLDPGFAAGDQLRLTVQVEAKNLAPKTGAIHLSIKYTDGTPAKTKVLKLPKGTYAYTQKLMSMIVASPNVKEIRVQIMVVKGKGLFRVDGISLEKVPASALILVPAAPDSSDLRGITR